MKYCKFCGNELFDEAVFCPQCKQSLIPRYTLTIVRPEEFGTKKMVHKLVVDNSAVYTINSGQTLDIVLPSGPHVLNFSFSFRMNSASKAVNVNLQKNTKLLLTLNRFGGGIDVFEIN